MSLWLAVGLVVTSYVSEDAALAGGALLAGNGSLPAAAAIAAVSAGIWSGDVALFLVGRLARRSASVTRWMDRRCPPERLTALESRLDRGAAVSILLSRVTPGTRLPLYLAAGLLPVRASVFVWCTLVASISWTAAVVLGVSWLS